MCQTSAGWVQEERKHVCHTIIGFRLILTFVQGCWSANFNHPRVDRNTSSGMLFGISEHDGVENDCNNRLFHLPTRKMNAKRSVLFSGGPFKDRGAWNNAASSWMWRYLIEHRWKILCLQYILFGLPTRYVHLYYWVKIQFYLLRTSLAYDSIEFLWYGEIHYIWQRVSERHFSSVHIQNFTWCDISKFVEEYYILYVCTYVLKIWLWRLFIIQSERRDFFTPLFLIFSLR